MRSALENRPPIRRAARPHRWLELTTPRALPCGPDGSSGPRRATRIPWAQPERLAGSQTCHCAGRFPLLATRHKFWLSPTPTPQPSRWLCPYKSSRDRRQFQWRPLHTAPSRDPESPVHRKRLHRSASRLEEPETPLARRGAGLAAARPCRMPQLARRRRPRPVASADRPRADGFPPATSAPADTTLSNAIERPSLRRRERCAIKTFAARGPRAFCRASHDRMIGQPMRPPLPIRRALWLCLWPSVADPETRCLHWKAPCSRDRLGSAWPARFPVQRHGPASGA